VIECYKTETICDLV